MQNIQINDCKITCADSLQLAATVFTPSTEVKSAVLIGPATGIKRQFYKNFALHLAEHGYGVIAFDNRGIGESLEGDIKTNNASLQCWGEKDMPAVLDHLKTCFPHAKYHLVGHSAGGQLIGLMHNALDISSMFNVASSSGQLRNMKPQHKLKAHFFMNFFIPLSNALFGYTKSQWVGMGEPLPKYVAKQWQTWCNGQGYVKTAFDKTIHNHFYDEIDIPSMWINTPDDFIANNDNVNDMLSVFTKMDAKTLTLTPEEYGLREIGHMKFFSKKSKVLWQHTIDWLNAH